MRAQQTMQALLKAAYRFAYALMRTRWFFTRPVTLGVRLLLVRDGEVLLVRHTYQDAWFFPGGGVKRGEDLEEAARREAAEECGATLGALELFGVYTHFYSRKSDHITAFFTRDFSLTGKSDLEIERVAFFPLDALPVDLSPGCRRRVEEFQRGDFPTWGMW